MHYNASKIVSFLGDKELSGCIELGAERGISLQELRDLVGSTSLFEGQDDTQVPISPPDDAPDIEGVIAYMESLKEMKGQQ